MFLLRYISEAEPRQAIQSATHKSGRFNEFVQWISFGGDNVIAENVRDEQRGPGEEISLCHLAIELLGQFQPVIPARDWPALRVFRGVWRFLHVRGSYCKYWLSEP
jgi:hypothetical protein